MAAKLENCSLLQKLSIVTLTYLLASSAAFGFCYGMRYYFDIHWHIIHLKEITYGLVIPLIASLIATFIIIKHIYRATGLTASVIITTLFSIYIPIMISQDYIVTHSYTLVPIKQPADVYKYPHQEYFSIQHFNITQLELTRDTPYYRVYQAGSSRHYHYRLFVARPLQAKNHPLKPPTVWAAVAYDNRYNANFMPDDEIQRRNHQYRKGHLADYHYLINSKITYFRRILYSYSSEELTALVRSHYPHIDTSKLVFLQPINAPFSQRSFIDKGTLLLCYLFGVLVFFIVVSIQLTKAR